MAFNRQRGGRHTSANILQHDQEGQLMDPEDLASWSQDEAKQFFDAFQEHGQDWEQVSLTIGTKSAEACDALHRKFKSFLALPKSLLNVTAFLAVVKDSLKIDVSEAETLSDPHAEGSSSDQDRGQRRSSYRQAMKAEQLQEDKDMVWAERRQRGQTIRGASQRTSQRPDSEEATPRRRRTARQHSADAGDADGIDALLSLANVAQEASYDQDSAEEETPARRPSRRVKKPKRHLDESDEEDLYASPRGRNSKEGIYSPTRRRGSYARQVKKRGGGETKPPTPRPKPPKKEVAVPAQPMDDEEEEVEEEQQPSASGAARSDAQQRASSHSPAPAEEAPDPPRGSGVRQSSRRTRRARDYDDDYVVKPPTKRSRRPPAKESEAQVSDDMHQSGAEGDEGEWPESNKTPKPRRRHRKSRPEKAPPMMAKAKVVFARRNTLPLSAPQPAFLLGVPPPNARISGIETEGQPSMGVAEIRLRHCLDPRVRRWCACEFFCSAIDRPWLMRNELLGYLTHVGIAKGTKLARPELAIIRASLGRPRRLSLNYLRQERIKLEAWREEVRAKYAEMGPGVELPAAYPKQLQVGQKAVARHPITRQLHDGDVLTVTSTSYRVQFERRELGVELVKDTDVMPVEPVMCLSQQILQASPKIALNGRYQLAIQSASYGVQPQAPAAPTPGSIQPGPNAAAFQSFPQIRSLDDMRRALDTKESLLARLRTMNDEVDAGMHKEENGERTAAFRKAYAQVLVDLELMNKTLESSRFNKQLPNAAPAPSYGSVPRRPPSPTRQEPVPPPAVLAPLPQMRPEPPKPAPSPPVEWPQVWNEAQELVVNLKRSAAPPEQQNTLAGPTAAGNSSAPGLQQSENGSREPSGVAGELMADDQAMPKSEEDARVSSMVTGCLSLMVALRDCSQRPQHSVESELVLAKALQSFQPSHASNAQAFNRLADKVVQLKSRLQAAE